jgi:hypothetical protein
MTEACSRVLAEDRHERLAEARGPVKFRPYVSTADEPLVAIFGNLGIVWFEDVIYVRVMLSTKSMKKKRQEARAEQDSPDEGPFEDEEMKMIEMLGSILASGKEGGDDAET